MEKRSFILVIEDDEILGASLLQRLRLESYDVRWAKTAAEALDVVARQTPDAIMCDIRLPDRDGESLMHQIFARVGSLPTIFMTAYGQIDQAVRLVRMGARDYVSKPFDIDDVIEKLKALAQAPADLRQGRYDTFGLAPEMRIVRRTLERVADVDLPVLLLGETGSGKEVAARFLHDASARAKKPFVAVNCAALAPELVDSALFGHEKGAFTGATERKAGFCETAADGTLFLDEIGELRDESQAKLLRIIEEREFVRVGGQKPLKFSARLVCATHRDLDAEVEKGGFREDLWFRINVVTVNIPALRDRRSEIETLLQRFVSEASIRLRREAPPLSRDAIKAALAYDWPGNVRELRNRVERAVALCDGPEIAPSDLFPDVKPSASGRSSGGAPARAAATLADIRDQAEKSHIEAVLQETGHVIQEAAARLGVSRTTLWEKMRRHAIKADDQGREP
jgi:DNA-binding NtrC family response regulator